MFENAVNAVALHEIIFNEANEPVDYVFLDVNSAFETHTGLRAEEVIGRRVTEVLPGIEDSPFIETYGRVVQNGEATSFERYFKPLGRHYHINAYKVLENHLPPFSRTSQQAKKRRNVCSSPKSRPKRPTGPNPLSWPK